jgi:hypothetical protein
MFILRKKVMGGRATPHSRACAPGHDTVPRCVDHLADWYQSVGDSGSSFGVREFSQP